jgi:IMP dehydrogenase
MKVVELMNKNVVTCHPSEMLSTIINKFELFGITGMPVVEKGKIVGIVSQSDILQKLKDGSVAGMVVKDVMVEDVITAAPAESVVAVAKLMIENKINRVPIVESDRVVGIVTRGDIIKAVAECG